MSLFQAVRFRLESGLFQLITRVIRLLPHSGARRLGRGLGRLVHGLDGYHRRIARANVDRALPELPPEERREIVRRCFQHFGLAVCDTISARRFDLESLCQRLDLEGWENLEAAEAAHPGVGTFLLSAHLGLWEIAAYPVGIYGGPLHVIGRPLDNPRLNAELESHRRRFGNELIPKRGAARPMLKTLARGGRVGILIDQRAKPNEAITVPFFGLPSLTTPVLARVALKTGAPVVPLFGYPAPGGRYRVVLRPAIPVSAVAHLEGEEAVAELTRLYLEATEAEIRRHPEMWLWLHRRWKQLD